MSRAGGKASRARREAENEYKLLDLEARADTMIVACEGCGLHQVHPIDACILCGCEIATFVESAQLRYVKTRSGPRAWTA